MKNVEILMYFSIYLTGCHGGLICFNTPRIEKNYEDGK